MEQPFIGLPVRCTLLMRLPFAVGLLLLVSSLCTHAQENSSGRPTATWDVQTIMASGTLRVALTRFDLPAFHQRRADGTLVGPEISLARQIAGALNVIPAFLDDAPSFDGVVDSVATGRADIGISKLSQTYYRLVRVRFSEPYITLRHALLYSRTVIAREGKGRPPDDVFRDFHGAIGVIGGSAYVDFARRNFPDARIVEMGSWDEVVQALRDGKVAAIYRDEFEIRRVLKLNPALNVGFGAAIVTDRKAFLSIAICDSCSKLQELINYHLADTRDAFTLHGLLNNDLQN
jgi:ABC-type amino acid transport substrate-binding protein